MLSPSCVSATTRPLATQDAPSSGALPIGGAPLLGASWVASGRVVALTQDGDSTAVDTYDLGGQKGELGSLDAGVAVVGGNGNPGIRVLDAAGSVFSPSGSFGWQDTGLNASFLASQQ